MLRFLRSRPDAIKNIFNLNSVEHKIHPIKKCQNIPKLEVFFLHSMSEQDFFLLIDILTPINVSVLILITGVNFMFIWVDKSCNNLGHNSWILQCFTLEFPPHLTQKEAKLKHITSFNDWALNSPIRNLCNYYVILNWRLIDTSMNFLATVIKQTSYSPRIRL